MSKMIFFTQLAIYHTGLAAIKNFTVFQLSVNLEVHNFFKIIKSRHKIACLDADKMYHFAQWPITLDVDDEKVLKVTNALDEDAPFYNNVWDTTSRNGV